MISCPAEPHWEEVGTLHRRPRSTVTLDNFDKLLVNDGSDFDIPLLIYDTTGEGDDTGNRSIPCFIAQKIKLPSSQQIAAVDDEKSSGSSLQVARTAVANCTAPHAPPGSGSSDYCARPKSLGSGDDGVNKASSSETHRASFECNKYLYWIRGSMKQRAGGSRGATPRTRRITCARMNPFNL